MELKKMELTSASGHDINLEALYQIMPSAFTEVRDEKTGEISHKINCKKSQPNAYSAFFAIVKRLVFAFNFYFAYLCPAKAPCG